MKNITICIDDDLHRQARMKACGTVLNEDLNHGQDCEGVAVVHPFLTEAGAT